MVVESVTKEDLILKKIDKLDEQMQYINIELIALKVEVAKEVSALKTKAGIWGVLGGGMTMLISIAIYFLQNRH